MSDSLDARAKRVFDDALDLQGVERDALLERACGSDVELRARVETLLSGVEITDAFLNDPTVQLAGTPAGGVLGAKPGDRIGPYRLLELVGEGGFGSVFLAEQLAPMRRNVALKIIKLGMDSQTVIKRFEQERQALALMDHPHIARVLDAGATDTGRPYFVMEFVRGEPITAFCNRLQLSISERLSLFAQSCRAVQHAHTKGVIHRDIKPSNVLAYLSDAHPECKIIDFGIAKAAGQPLTEDGAVTEIRQIMGTPAYMSPEQAAGSLDIDTRSDIYSLGVVLYELLAGATPFDAQRLRASGPHEFVRLLRDVDPPTPSARLARMSAMGNVAAERGTEPRRLASMLRGELDWIAMRALDRDRARRYESAGELAADVMRYLSGAPILAAPPSLRYRMGKFLRRHAWGAVACGAVIVALCTGLGVALWQAGIAADERDKQVALTSKAVAAEKLAEQRRQETEQVADFQAEQLSGIDPQQMGHKLCDEIVADLKSELEQSHAPADVIDARLAQLRQLLGDVNSTNIALRTLQDNILDRALQSVNEKFAQQPLIRARLLESLSETMVNLGLLDRAEGPQRAALEIRREQFGADASETLESAHHLGFLLYSQGRLPEAEVQVRDTLERVTRMLGPDHHLTLDSLSLLGVVLQLQNRLEESEKLQLAALAGCKRVYGSDHVDTLGALNNLGFLSFVQGQYAEAEHYFREALGALRRQPDAEKGVLLVCMNNLASMLQRQDKFGEAEAMFREAYDTSRAQQGEEHPATLQFANNLGFVLYLQNRLAESEPYTVMTLERRRRVLTDDHYDTMQSVHNLGLLYQAEGHFEQAEPLLREALERRTRVLGADHQATCQSLSSLGQLLMDQGRLDEAEPLLVDALTKCTEKLGADHPDTIEVRERVGTLLAAEGRLAESELELRRALNGIWVAFGENQGSSARTAFELGEVLVRLNRFSEAEPLLLHAESVLCNSSVQTDGLHQHCIDAIVHLYDGWNAERPNAGFAQKADDWRKARQ